MLRICLRQSDPRESQLSRETDGRLGHDLGRTSRNRIGAYSRAPFGLTVVSLVRFGRRHVSSDWGIVGHLLARVDWPGYFLDAGTLGHLYVWRARRYRIRVPDPVHHFLIPHKT